MPLIILGMPVSFRAHFSVEEYYVLCSTGYECPQAAGLCDCRSGVKAHEGVGEFERF